jgi:iron(III) transport system ATP-binding protein
MSDLGVKGLSKRFGATVALDGVDLAVASGSLVAVLGPSGSGKTTLLRCIAGFEHADAGRLEVDGQDVTGRPPERRRIAVVPQEGALFPHLTVAGNVGYGLPRAARRSGRVDEVLDLLGLSGFGRRMPHELSGGQQQRVAVARALAPRPPVVLLDEPFSALDAALRVDVRRMVQAALRADGATAVLVTHDQGEALSMADEVAVMRSGRIVQSAPPPVVYAEPADTWIARFVGEAVLLPATVQGGRASTVLGELPVSGAGRVVLVRPEQIEVGCAGGQPAVVVGRAFHGHDALLTARLDGGTEVLCRVFGSGPGPGERITVRVRGTVRALADDKLADDKLADDKLADDRLSHDTLGHDKLRDRGERTEPAPAGAALLDPRP